MSGVIEDGLGLSLIGLQYVLQPVDLPLDVVQGGIGHIMDVLGRDAQGLLTVIPEHPTVIDGIRDVGGVLVVFVGYDDGKSPVVDFGSGGNVLVHGAAKVADGNVRSIVGNLVNHHLGAGETLVHTQRDGPVLGILAVFL